MLAPGSHKASTLGAGCQWAYNIPKAPASRTDTSLPWGVLETSTVAMTTFTLNTGQSSSIQESALCRAAQAGRGLKSAMLVLTLTAGFPQPGGKAHSDLRS